MILWGTMFAITKAHHCTRESSLLCNISWGQVSHNLWRRKSLQSISWYCMRNSSLKNAFWGGKGLPSTMQETTVNVWSLQQGQFLCLHQSVQVWVIRPHENGYSRLVSCRDSHMRSQMPTSLNHWGCCLFLQHSNYLT